LGVAGWALLIPREAPAVVDVPVPTAPLDDSIHTATAGRRSSAYGAAERFHPHGYGLPTRGPGGEGSLGTELRGEIGDAEDNGGVPLVA
jgi:hypothetical protein